MNTKKESKKQRTLPLQMRLEISNVITTNLLNRIYQQDNEIKEIKLENEILKKNLAFILKKIMLNNTPQNLNTSNFHNNSVLHTENTNRFYFPHRSMKSYVNSPAKPTNSFQYIPTEYNTINNNTSIHVENKINDYITTLYKRNKNVVNSRKNYLIYKSSSSLYDDIFNTERKNGNSSYIFTENGLNKNNSQRQINSMAKKASLNKISYRNLSMKNINNSRLQSERNEPRNNFNTPRTHDKYYNHSNLKSQCGSSNKKDKNGKSLYKIRIRQKISSRSPYLANKL